MRYCFNCHYPLPVKAKYCPQCSQKYTTGKVNVHDLIHDLIHTQLHLDSVFFHTLQFLFIPGRLTKVYFKGRHKRYAHPIRLFIVLGAFCFAMINFQSHQFDESIEVLNEGVNRGIAEQYFIKSIQPVKDSIRHSTRDSTAAKALDSLFNAIQPAGIGLGGDTITINNIFNIAVADVFTMSTTEMFKKYEITGFWEKLIVKQFIKIVKEGKGIGHFLISKSFWMMFLLMPFLALVLTFLYRRREHYYVEHLIFLFHYHSFLFLITPLLMLSGAYLPVDNLAPISIIGILLYLFVAMKTYYGLSIWKTFLKFSSLCTAYLILFMFFLVCTLVIGFLMY